MTRDMVIFMSGVFYFYSYFVSHVPECCRHVLVIVSLLKKRDMNWTSSQNVHHAMSS